MNHGEAYAEARQPLPEGYSTTVYAGLTVEQRQLYEEQMLALLVPLYGPQETALAKIREGQDRTAEVVVDAAGRPSATLVYKNMPVSETHCNRVTGDMVRTENVFEIKTLALFDPRKDGGKGLGRWLVARAESVAHQMNANGIVVTTHPGLEAEGFFEKHGYLMTLFITRKTHGSSWNLRYKSLREGGLIQSDFWRS